MLNVTNVCIRAFAAEKEVICGDRNVFEVKTARPGEEVYMMFESEAADVEMSVVRLQL